MATKSTNPTTRETSATTFDRGERNLIVTIHHGVIKIRPKGLKSEEVSTSQQSMSMPSKPALGVSNA